MEVKDLIKDEKTEEDLKNDPTYQKAKNSVFVQSTELKGDIVKGYDFNQGVDYHKIFESYKTMGFQAMNMGRAIDIINDMIKYRLSDDPIDEEEDDEYKDPEVRKKTRCTIFLGYTSNMASCGMRDIIRYLCEHKMIDAIVTTCGGIEEDFIKCLAPFSETLLTSTEVGIQLNNAVPPPEEIGIICSKTISSVLVIFFPL